MPGHPIQPPVGGVNGMADGGGAMVQRRRGGPSRWWYLLSPLALVVGLSLTFYIALASLVPCASNAFTQLEAPGSTTVDLDAGTQYILVAPPEGARADPAALADLQVTVAAADSGETLPVSRVDDTRGFAPRDREAAMMLQVVIDQPGRYRIAASYPEGREGPAATLLLVRGDCSRAGVAQRAGALCCASLLLAIVIPVGVFLARRNANRPDDGPATPPGQPVPTGEPT
jgi:hypothetical protein